MPPFNIRIEVFQKPEILDPESEVIRETLPRFDPALEGRVLSLRKGQLFELSLDMEDSESARLAAQELAASLLSNPNLHQYNVSIEPTAGASE
jgi:phosphoribosylformylglycinamidine (FGAM) synthase PurS component